MIKSIKLKNLFSHEDSLLNFSPGVNIICGKSNDGKSAIRRAICWVADNRPLGVGMIRYYYINGEKHLTEEALAELVKDANGKIITVSRSKTKNSNGKYTIADGESKISLSSFGQAPPPEVLDVINLNEINIQRQLSPYFLAFDPPGQVATFLRSITKLNEIDSVCNLISSKLRKVQKEIDSNKSELCDTNARIGELERINLESLEQKIKESKKIIDTNTVLETKIKKLFTIVCQIDDLLKKSINIPDNCEKILQSSLFLKNQHNELINDYRNLKSIIFNIKSIRNTEINVVDANGILEQNEKIIKTYNKYKNNYDKLFKIIEKINKINALTNDIKHKLELEERSKKEIEEQLVECPKCGAKLTEESKHRVLNDY